MLLGIDPLLTGPILHRLDAMGHSDAVAVVDAHFPADRFGEHAVVVELPGISSPAVLAAVRSVLPPDDAPALDLMTSADGTRLPIQDELVRSAAVPEESVRFIDRFEFYDVTTTSRLVLRCGETRTYGCALFRKGIV